MKKLLAAPLMFAASAAALSVPPPISFAKPVADMGGKTTGTASAGGSDPGPNIAAAPSVIATFRPGRTAANFGKRDAVTAVDVGRPMIGRGVDCDASVQTGPYAVCEYAGLWVHAGRSGPGYAINGVYQVDATAGSIPGSVAELNINNDSVDSVIAADVDPLYGSVSPWTTGLNIIPGGTHRITAGLVIDSAGGLRSHVAPMQYGAWIGGSTVDADLELAGAARSAIRIVGPRSAAIDASGMTTSGASGAPLALLMPSTGYIGSVGSDKIIRSLLSLDGDDAIDLGQAGVNIRTGGSLSVAGTMVVASARPASSSAPCTTGTITWDGDYVYVCVAASRWKRSALATF